MGHYRLSDDMPSAIILAKNPRNGSLDELKTYQNNEIFLNNGTEFQIRLFNPLQEKIGAKITFNGKTSNHLLVLNPGEDSIIDRFIEEQRKMIFETYKYDSNNEKAEKAVQKNGIIDISFYKESVFFNTCGTWNYDYYKDTTIPYDGTIFTTNDTTIGNTPYSTLTNTSGMGNITSGNVFLNQSEVSLDSLEFADEQVKSKKSPKLKSLKSKKSLKETGRVEKGQKSDQQFDQININFETFPFYSVSYFLKPMSEKSISTKEIRNYCENCSYRIRNKKWNYCPKCGQKV